jgi:hypothetical protein
MLLLISFREGRHSMGATFKIRVRSEGTSNQKAYEGKDGKKFTNLMIGALENTTLDLTGRMVAKTGLEASERTLWFNAIYFQRIVARTPRDEDYTYIGKDGKTYYHKGEAGSPKYVNDHMQDFWTAKYWNYEPITAKYLRENCGCTFEKLNDPKEIKIIYKEFRNRFFGAVGSKGRANKESGKTTLKSVRIFCDYPKDKQHELRYHYLEYGGYISDGVIKAGDKYFHGVVNKHSVQAPKGMTAITKAEYEAGQFQVPGSDIANKDLLKNIGPKRNMPKALKDILKKEKLSDSDVRKVMEFYGV